MTSKSRKRLGGAVANLVVSRGAFRRLIPLVLWPLVLDCSGRRSSALLSERSVVFGSSTVKRCFDQAVERVGGLCRGIGGSLRERGWRLEDRRFGRRGGGLVWKMSGLGRIGRAVSVSSALGRL